MSQNAKFGFLTAKSDAIEDDAKDDWLAGSNLDLPAEELVEMARKIWRAGEGMCFPVMFELRSPRGNIAIAGDLFEELARLKSSDRGFWGDMLMAHKRRLIRGGATARLDSMFGHRGETEGLAAMQAAGLRLAMGCCMDWAPRSGGPIISELWDNTENDDWLCGGRALNVVMKAGASGLQSPDAIEALYVARARQATELESRLAFAYSVSAAKEEDSIDVREVWRGFAAKRQAMAIELASNEGLTRKSKAAL